MYKKRYKGIGIALNVLNSALGGNYVCFGVGESGGTQLGSQV